jgi:hypothetical protein
MSVLLVQADARALPFADASLMEKSPNGRLPSPRRRTREMVSMNTGKLDKNTGNVYTGPWR